MHKASTQYKEGDILVMRRVAQFLILVFLIVLSSQCDRHDGKKIRAVVLQPGSEDGKDALLTSDDANQNYGNYNGISANVFPDLGPPLIERSLFEFDLTQIPAGSEILLASLSLYYDQADSTHITLSGPNTAFLQRIITTWDESTVTWNNQPTVDILNQVILNSSTGPDQDYPEIDVTILLQDMVNNQAMSFGFLIRLESEYGRRGLYFASSDHANPALHPKLHIRYLH